MGRKRGKGGNGGETPPAGEELLTVQQVAENWQVWQRMIRRMIANGRLPVIRLGRAVRIPARWGRT
jgi:excisionase family DNA binding protein